MKTSDSRRYAPIFAVAAIMLAGCGGSQAGGSPGIPQSVTSSVDHPARDIASVTPDRAIAGLNDPSSGVIDPRVKIATGHFKARRPEAYTWSQLKTPFSKQPYAVRTKVQYFTGTAPVTLAPTVPSGDPYGILYANIYALLDHTDSLGDYTVYDYDDGSTEWFFWNAYMSGLALDGTNDLVVWGITKKGTIWSTFPSTNGKWTRYFVNYTSLAVQNPKAPNPTGFLFATSSKSTTKGSQGPSGSTIMLYDPTTGKWPNGTWKKTGWGAYQVSADPLSTIVAALDENGNIWEIAPNYTKGNPRKFIGYLAGELGTTECSNHAAISFVQVALKAGIFLGLGGFGSVWSYDTRDKCWSEVGSKDLFVSIATDAGNSFLVWASDSKGKIWIAM